MDIILSMKGGFGMLLDKQFYEKYVSEFKNSIKKIFGEDMIKELSEKKVFENRGYFRLEFFYIPDKYKIVVENEIRTFDITIEDEDGESNSLYRIEHFENVLENNNVFLSIMLLKKVIERNDFNFYFHKDGKLYRRNRNGIKRIKDLRELQNG